MKAIRIEQFGGPEVLGTAEIPDPIPASGQVLVRLHAAGINPVETYIRSGKYAKLPALPFTPGTDGAGRVVTAGAESGFAEGERVYVAGSLTGTYAELCVCEEAQVHPLPDSVAFTQGAALGVPYATAYRALFQRAQAQAGETVLIHGATGGVGQAALQFALGAGLTVFATGGSEEGRERLRAQGAHAVFDHHAPAYAEAILQETSGRGVGVIVEMLASVNLGRDLTLLAPGGRVVVVGSRGSVELDPRNLMSREADIRGVMLGAATPGELAEAHRAIGAGLLSGALQPLVSRQFPLAQAPAAHEAVMAGAAAGKVVLVL